MLEYRLLGPVQVYDDGRLIEAGPPRQRLVLAALLVDAGEVVGWDTLVDRVWGEQTPVDARGSMRAHITRIPLVESLTAALMRAQHALGRSADALAEYNRLRTRLAEELGTDPGPELQALYRTMLRGEQAPVRATSPGSRPVAAVVPAQLPADVHGFAGRVDQLGRLDALLTRPDPARTAVVISAVSGTAGVGKSTLAVRWAHRVADRFPDGQLYVNLRGFDPGGQVMDPTEAVRRFLEALGVEPRWIPADPDGQAALYRSQLATRRMLIVLDNARDIAQVRPLLPGAPTCLVLVTSRNQLTGLIATDGAHPIPLDLLSAAEARELLAQRLGADRIAAEPEAVAEIRALCAHLPLALALVAARAAIRPQVALGALAVELRDTGQRWQMLTGDDPTTDVRSVFSWSYEALTPGAARLFRLLGLHPGPDITAPAAASLAGLPTGTVRPLLAELTGASLLVEHIAGRYAFHDLLRAYATDLTHATDPEQERHAATRRMLDHYLHSAYAAERLLNPTRDPLDLAPTQPGVTPEQPADHQQATSWFVAEHAVLLAAVDRAATGFDTHTWQLASSLWTYQFGHGRLHDWIPAGRAAAAAAARQGDRPAQGLALRKLAQVYMQLRRLDDADSDLRHALDLYRQAGDTAGQAHTENSLSQLCDERDRPAEALDHARAGPRSVPGGGSRAGTGPGPQLGRLVPRPPRRAPAGARRLPAGPHHLRGTRRPLRAGRDVGQPRLRPPATRRPNPRHRVLPEGRRPLPGHRSTAVRVHGPDPPRRRLPRQRRGRRRAYRLARGAAHSRWHEPSQRGAGPVQARRPRQPRRTERLGLSIVDGRATPRCRTARHPRPGPGRPYRPWPPRVRRRPPTEPPGNRRRSAR